MEGQALFYGELKVQRKGVRQIPLLAPKRSIRDDSMGEF